MTVVAVSAQLGLFAVWLLTLNLLLGLLLSMRYNPLKQWPHRRINYFTVHNWTGYIALALCVGHVAILPLSDTAGWVWRDVIWPSQAPQQPTFNVLGALGLYLLTVVVATSYLRRRMGRKSWKAIHYAAYASALLFYLHGIVLDPKLQDRPLNLIDPEKLSQVICVVLVVWVTWLRVRHALRRRAIGRAKDQKRWDAPDPNDWQDDAQPA